MEELECACYDRVMLAPFGFRWGTTSVVGVLPRRLRRLAAAVAGRLIGDPRVMRAIGQAGQRLAAAEEEFRARGIADRPVAGGLVQFRAATAAGSSAPRCRRRSDPAPARPRRHGPARCCRARPGAIPASCAGPGGALRWRGAAEEGLLARPDRPSRCTLPITALRVTFPSSAAIWLAESPASQSFFSCSTRSSDQVNTVIALFPSRRAGRLGAALRCQSSQKSLPAESLSPRRARKARPNVYAEHCDLEDQDYRTRCRTRQPEEATIWRDSRARVRASASTCSVT